ncbi:hypothetical protein AB5J62_26265 [Amycolatopsis sp. cg5]|uniref:hypothetical protein n=1 Tax=Amycolatopsis sp. cg5 TaxID=3238802 RepID=UPI003526904F
MTNTGSQIIKAIEAAWRSIQKRHPEVPDVVAITGTGIETKNKVTLAHFWARRWQERGDDADMMKMISRKAELFVSGELLGMDGVKIMEALLHEAAHGLNHARKVKGTTSNGYHNMVFVAAANELGLIWPEGKQKHSTIGFSHCEITEKATKTYGRTIAALESARLHYLTSLVDLQAGQADENDEEGEEAPTGGPGSRGGTRRGKRIYVICECDEPDPFPITPGRLDRAPILCGDCGEPFRARDGE